MKTHSTFEQSTIIELYFLFQTNKLLETTYKLVKENQMLKEEDRLLTSKNKCYVEEKIVIQEKNISQLKVYLFPIKLLCIYNLFITCIIISNFLR